MKKEQGKPNVLAHEICSTEISVYGPWFSGMAQRKEVNFANAAVHRNLDCKTIAVR